MKYIAKDLVIEAMRIIAQQNKRDTYPMSLINDVYHAVNHDADHVFKVQVIALINFNTQSKSLLKGRTEYALPADVTALAVQLKKTGMKARLADLVDVDATLLCNYLSLKKRMPLSRYLSSLENLPIVLKEFGVAA